MVSEYILKVDSTGFSDELNVEHEHKRGVKDCSKIFISSNGRILSVLAEDKTM